MMAELEDKAGAQAQRLAWEALKKSINGLINKVGLGGVRGLLAGAGELMRPQDGGPGIYLLGRGPRRIIDIVSSCACVQVHLCVHACVRAYVHAHAVVLRV